MPSVVADTNVFLRFLIGDIPEQFAEAEQLFKKARQGKIELIVPQIVLFEIYYALEKHYHLPKEVIIQKLEVIIAAEYLQVQNREIFRVALELFKKCKLEITDCFILQFAKEKQADLFTFDKDLRNLALNQETADSKK